MKTKKLKQFRKTKKHYKKINKKLRKTLNKKGGGRGQECKLKWHGDDFRKMQQSADAQKCRYYAYRHDDGEWYMMRDIRNKKCGKEGKWWQRKKCPQSKDVLNDKFTKRSTTKDDIEEAKTQLDKVDIRQDPRGDAVSSGSLPHPLRMDSMGQPILDENEVRTDDGEVNPVYIEARQISADDRKADQLEAKAAAARTKAQGRDQSTRHYMHQ